MKIVIVQDHLRSGGTERQSVYLARAFFSLGHETTLITFRPGGILEHLEESNRFEPNLIHLQPFDTGLDWLALGLTSTALKLSPDIILCHGRMANCYAGLLQEALPKCVVIGTLRTGKKLPYFFRKSLLKVKAIIANSQDTKDRLVHSLNITREKITVIYNSLIFKPADENKSNLELREKLGANLDTVLFLCVAMFRAEKRQADLIKIVSRLPENLDWKLVFVGDGKERSACERLVEQLNLKKRIVFSGFNPDPTPFYALSDIAVHASERESLSNFLIEAQAHGLPAVVYPAQGIIESMILGETGWIIERGNEEGFRAKLIELCNDSVLVKKERSQSARLFAGTRFDSEKQVSLYIALFTTLLAKK